MEIKYNAERAFTITHEYCTSFTTLTLVLSFTFSLCVSLKFTFIL